ncbi:LacI family transcriptional regulator [Paenibacillus mesophilus]|uniref:LacI family DNA-binding transcriptional regulator n=1 Tax=Paenibacillus mesophilus TaxID=2582849 RepID=UPI00110EFC18|nr:LacI family DNA-binding transcriptional regulator [Paenibacillus mesophilus]TMV51590.1 LacI family transcriptional regulator [Paenibacillus mesophilus]
MTKKISMQHIADRLGLSKYSVSQALSGKAGVSEDTREKVIEMAKALGYKLGPTKQDTFPIPGVEPPTDKKSFVLIWIKPDRRRDVSFWSRVLNGIIDACEELGWDHLIISGSADDQEFAFPSYADRSSCIGTIMMGSLPDSLLMSIKKQGLPIILADHYDPYLDLDCVVNANFEAAKTMCQNMISAKSRSIVFVGDDNFSISFSERRWGCQIAVQEENERRGGNIEFGRWKVPYGGPWRIALETEIKNMEESKLPDCFICANDDIAIGLISLLKKNGYSIPKQFKVVGFDDIEAASHSNPTLTTVDFGKEVLGRRTVEALRRRMSMPEAPTEKTVLSYRLVVRQSG